jgi:hypothetical protein
MRDLTASDNHMQLDLLYALPDPHRRKSRGHIGRSGFDAGEVTDGLAGHEATGAEEF